MNNPSDSSNFNIITRIYLGICHKISLRVEGIHWSLDIRLGNTVSVCIFYFPGSWETGRVVFFVRILQAFQRVEPHQICPVGYRVIGKMRFTYNDIEIDWMGNEANACPVLCKPKFPANDYTKITSGDLKYFLVYIG